MTKCYPILQVIHRATASRSSSNPFRRLPRPLQGTLAPPPRQVTQPKPQVQYKNINICTCYRLSSMYVDSQSYGNTTNNWGIFNWILSVWSCSPCLYDMYVV